MEDEDRKAGEEVGDDVRANEAQKDGASRGVISEDEARRLLTEEKQRVETGLKKADKRGKRVLVTVVVAAVVLCLVGLVIGVVMRGEDDGGKREEVGSGVEEKTGDPEKPEVPTEKEVKVEELSLDDEVVQRLYAYFKRHIGELTYDFYSENGGLSGNIDDRLMTALAFSNMDLPSIFLYATENDLGCYDARPVRDKVYEIFGERIDFHDGMGILLGEYPLYVYSAADNAFCLKGGFGSGVVGVHHNLYKAEKDDTRVYLYVVGGRVDTRGEYGTVRPVDLSNTNEFLYHSTGNDETDILEYADKLDKYKWTFVKNEEGNYVFEKLEKVEK